MRKPVRDRTPRDYRIPHRAKAVIDNCEHCGWTPPEAKLLHAHHIVALAVGGSDTLDNVAVLCPNCHSLAHYVTSRALGRHLGPSTREQLFISLQSPKPPTFSLDELRAMTDMLSRRDAQ